MTAALLGDGLWLISDRAAAARKIETEQAATERDADTDLREMVQWMRRASWPEARNADQRQLFFPVVLPQPRMLPVGRPAKRGTRPQF